MPSKVAAPSGELASHGGCLHMPLDIKVGEAHAYYQNLLQLIRAMQKKQLVTTFFLKI
jgi:hypothetical protein